MSPFDWAIVASSLKSAVPSSEVETSTFAMRFGDVLDLSPSLSSFPMSGHPEGLEGSHAVCARQVLRDSMLVSTADCFSRVDVKLAASSSS
jgi:hypothetical protein